MTLQVVVGGQFGSEGKGAVAAFLSGEHKNGLSVRVAGPNAGHTVIGRCPPDCHEKYPVANVTAGKGGNVHDGHAPDAHPWRLRQVPVAAVSNESATLLIAQGSEIDPGVLDEELTQLDAAGYKASARLLVDEQATIITSYNKEIEVHGSLGRRDLVTRIGSTGKGIGAARADRAMRVAALAGHYYHSPRCPWPANLAEDGADLIRQHLHNDGEVLIEGTQGYFLGSHAGHYPQVTSSDCTAMDFLAMAGIAPWEVRPSRLEIWVVFRTFPIRVAGNSGPLDNEVTWESLGLEPELTTVTRKTRRVGLWNGMQARKATIANGLGRLDAPFTPVRTALTMADYVLPSVRGATRMAALEDSAGLEMLLAQYGKDMGIVPSLVGTGPATMLDLRLAF